MRLSQGLVSFEPDFEILHAGRVVSLGDFRGSAVFGVRLGGNLPLLSCLTEKNLPFEVDNLQKKQIFQILDLNQCLKRQVQENVGRYTNDQVSAAWNVVWCKVLIYKNINKSLSVTIFDKKYNFLWFPKFNFYHRSQENLESIKLKSR